MTATDTDLLAKYLGQNSQDAFAALVNRHLNLVYSAALRQVRSPQLAEEIAQSAFTDLARDAHRLAPDTVLTAWLYQVTRRTAIDVVRRESRRQLREQIATELNAMNATADDWAHIEPLLDDAVSALDEVDRAAVLLRYFENKSFREVGQTLGSSEDAAQKRVSRAVERLREFFTRRGVTIGTSGIVVAVSANAVQAAPVGLALTISTTAAVAGATLATTATVTATKAIAMTTLQKFIVATTLTAAVGTGIYEAREAAHAQTEVRSLQRQHAPLAAQVAQLAQERDEAAHQLAALRNENERLNKNTTELLRLRNEVGGLKRSSLELSNRLAATDGKKNWGTTQKLRWLRGKPAVNLDSYFNDAAVAITNTALSFTTTNEMIYGAALLLEKIPNTNTDLVFAAVNDSATLTLGAKITSVDEAPVIHGSPASGALIIEWKEQWYPAEILESKDGKHLVHYTGYDAKWDEWVGEDRMARYAGDEQAAQP